MEHKKMEHKMKEHKKMEHKKMEEQKKVEDPWDHANVETKNSATMMEEKTLDSVRLAHQLKHIAQVQVFQHLVLLPVNPAASNEVLHCIEENVCLHI